MRATAIQPGRAKIFARFYLNVEVVNSHTTGTDIGEIVLSPVDGIQGRVTMPSDTRKMPGK
ncbi:hypothetical protein [Microbulbifer epialgicus]|uniref:hypothetical protein n=1 Tax=Microbulbifer epialgicus TaxID=393907 RepID=UPI003530C69D